MNPRRSDPERLPARGGWLILLVLVGLIWGSVGPARAGYDTAVVTLTTDTGLERGRVRVLVARTPRQQYLGLSHFRDLDTGTGMLFSYDREDTRSFYMRSMDFPLDILFIDADRRVRRIVTAPRPDPATPPEDLERYRGRARWVLEVNAGWSRDRGVRTGDRLQFGSRLPRDR